MKFLSVCSGIEAASVSWNPLGWKAVAFSEIEPFPCAVLAHHYPDVPNWGDMTKFQEWPDADIDVLCGGTPCQSFSVAGLRKGLDDPRGNLMLTFGAIAARHRPKWLVWENVPGVLSSNEGRDFGAFLGMLGQLGYGFAYRVLDAQYFGVPQRRRRVFVVGCLGDWRSAAAVLFERHSLSGHPAPSRQARQGIAPTLSARTKGGGGLGTDFDCDGGLVTGTLDASYGRLQGCSGQDANHGHSHLVPLYSIHPHCIGRAPDAGPQGKEWLDDGTAYCQDSRPTAQAIAFSAKDHGADAMQDCSPTLRAGGHSLSHANAGVMPAIAFNWQGGGTQTSLGHDPDASITGALSVGQTPAIASMQVRRLTPEECEALQGFSHGYTAIPYRGKRAADGPRYKALGNSWAVPCARWIGQRIGEVEALSRADSRPSLGTAIEK